MLKAVLFDMDQTLIDWDQVQEPWDAYILRRLQGVYDYVDAQVQPLRDKTLVDFVEAYIRVLNKAWTNGIQTLQPPHISRVLLAALSACGVPQDRLDSAAIMQIYEEHWEMPVGERAYPDVVDVLPQLEQHSIEMGIITNASHPMVHRDRELERTGILAYFPRCRLSAADVGYLKPHSAIFEHALDMLGLQPDEAVFVGDNLHADVGGAQGVGMRGVWRVNQADQELQQAELDIEADGKINTFHDLLTLLDEWYPAWRNRQRA